MDLCKISGASSEDNHEIAPDPPLLDQQFFRRCDKGLKTTRLKRQHDCCADVAGRLASQNLITIFYMSKIVISGSPTDRIT